MNPDKIPSPSTGRQEPDAGELRLPACGVQSCWSRAALQRYETCMGLGFDAGRLGYLISGLPDEEAVRNRLWDNPLREGKMIGVLLSLCSWSREAQADLSCAPLERDSAFQRISRSLIRERSLRDLHVAEIGGSLARLVLSPLGASVTCCDGGWDKAAPHHVDRPENLVNLRNYRTFFPASYDVSLTCKVLDEGSGLEAITPELSGKEAARAAGLQLLAVLSNITRPGGLSLHSWFSPALRFELPFFGFRIERELIEGERMDRMNLMLLSRQEPDLSRYPLGIRSGAARIVFDPQQHIFRIADEPD